MSTDGQLQTEFPFLLVVDVLILSCSVVLAQIRWSKKSHILQTVQLPATEKKKKNCYKTDWYRTCPSHLSMDYDFGKRKKAMRFGTRNMRPLATPGAADELAWYIRDLVALQEVRWSNEGKTSTSDHQIKKKILWKPHRTLSKG